MGSIRDRDLQSLLDRKKLHLVLDLDHTLLHAKERASLTMEDKQLIRNPKTVLHGIHNGSFLVKFRPGLGVFLKEVSTMFDLSIFTMGTREYAKLMRELLEGCFGGGEVRFREVLSRDDCVIDRDKKSLDYLVSSYERVVVIVDDTEEVWKNSSRNEENLVKIDPYVFFPCSRAKVTPMDEELSRVLKVLVSVYEGFYGFGKGDCSEGDVREVLKLVKKNRKRTCFSAFDSDSVVPAKRYKVRTSNAVDNLRCFGFACLAC